MISVGTEPFLEVRKSHGADGRFDDRVARVFWFGGRNIATVYQTTKQVEIDGVVRNYLPLSETEGLPVLNQEECNAVYSKCWDVYFEENPNIIDILNEYNGFTDADGIEGQPSAAIELLRIKQNMA